MSKAESEQVRNQILKSWNFDGYYWNPLDKKSPKPIIFLMDDNIKNYDKLEIEKSIKEHIKADKFFVITEDRIDYELGKELLNIDFYEKIICDNTFEWVVYGSHESTTTFGGDFLINIVNKLFINRNEKLNKWEQNW